MSKTKRQKKRARLKKLVKNAEQQWEFYMRRLEIGYIYGDIYSVKPPKNDAYHALLEALNPNSFKEK